MASLRACLEGVMGNLYLDDGRRVCLSEDLLRGNVPEWPDDLLDVEAEVRLFASGDDLLDAPAGQLSGVIRFLSTVSRIGTPHFVLRRLPNVLDRLMVYKLWEGGTILDDRCYCDRANWLPAIVKSIGVRFGKVGWKGDFAQVDVVAETSDGSLICIADCIRSGRRAWRPPIA